MADIETKDFNEYNKREQNTSRASVTKLSQTATELGWSLEDDPPRTFFALDTDRGKARSLFNFESEDVSSSGDVYGWNYKSVDGTTYIKVWKE